MYGSARTGEIPLDAESLIRRDRIFSMMQIESFHASSARESPSDDSAQLVCSGVLIIDHLPYLAEFTINRSIDYSRGYLIARN